MSPLVSYIAGATAMASFAVGLFFLRFWRETRDRLFLIFAAAFAIMAINRTLAAWTGDSRPALYWLRLLAFVLIALAVIDKNRDE